MIVISICEASHDWDYNNETGDLMCVFFIFWYYYYDFLSLKNGMKVSDVVCNIYLFFKI